MKHPKYFLILVLLVLCTSGQTSESPCARETVKKIERPMVWQPKAGAEQVAIWPKHVDIDTPEVDGNPETVGNGSKLVAGRTWNWATYVSSPTMTIYKPARQNTGGAVLVLPGGGYRAVAMDLEGTEICDWLTELGITCIILKYRVPQVWQQNSNAIGQPPEVLLPLHDAQRAMSLLRQNANSYEINPNKIGVIGFSAGGHLAAALSNAAERKYMAVDAADQKKSRPNFAIILYPGRLWDRSLPKTNLTLAPWVEISLNAPSTLLIHAMNDPVDDIRHSIAYGMALNDVGVPVDMHLYAKGCHAFGMRPTSDPITTEWPMIVIRWLQHLDVL